MGWSFVVSLVNFFSPFFFISPSSPASSNRSLVLLALALLSPPPALAFRARNPTHACDETVSNPSLDRPPYDLLHRLRYPRFHILIVWSPSSPPGPRGLLTSPEPPSVDIVVDIWLAPRFLKTLLRSSRILGSTRSHIPFIVDVFDIGRISQYIFDRRPV